MIRRFIIYGVLGDLAARYLLPALSELQAAGALPVGFSVTGVGLEDFDTESVRPLLAERLERVAPDMDDSRRSALLAALDYRRGDVTRRDDVTGALGPAGEPVVVYLALPPGLFAPSVEALALEGRASYYDRAGALRDMVQNHLLQLLCLAGMEAPRTLGDRDFRDRKADVLRAVRRLSPEEAERWTVRGRYAAGRVGDRDVRAYAKEDGVDPGRGTETFVETVLWVDNWRWAGVPFLLRTGKALRRDRTEIAVHFKPVPHPVFGEESVPCPNVLRLEMNPDRIAFGVNVTRPGEPLGLDCVEMERELAPQDLSAYALLLLHVLQGRPELFIRGDEAEESWRIVEPILEAWSAERRPLLEYPAGSDGSAAVPGTEHRSRRGRGGG